MIDFNKRLGQKAVTKKLNPVEIYDDLDRKSETGSLRPIQFNVLTEWHENFRSKKDIILKLHTGQGKTLIGLLILQSKLNSKEGPCIYICPNKYLVRQICSEAEKFGIGYCTMENSLPEEFKNSEKILITHVQKVFNGKSKFGFGGQSQNVGTLILDDSHSCIEAINDAFKIKVNSEHAVYKRMFTLFEEDLREQGEGSFLEIESGEKRTLLPVPYWCWQDKQSEILKILLDHKERDEVRFTWPVIKDNLNNCQCFFSGNGLEISTFLNPIYMFGTFSNTKSRILMSATTQNDSFFVKGLGFSPSAVKNPLTVKNEKWLGEKMLLIPSLIHESLDRNWVASKFGGPIPSNQFNKGRVVITTSNHKAKSYENYGAEVLDKQTIFNAIDRLKSGDREKTAVIVNRYDGIDLPDDSCRILILDCCPFADSLTERYEENCRSTSEITSIKLAQKIEQGLGRSVRGEKDYSIIILVGNDLVKFVKSTSSNKYFSAQTRKQVDIGLDLATFSREEDLESGKEPAAIVSDLIWQSIKRDDGWKEFYIQQMNSIDEENFKVDLTHILEEEKQAEEEFFRNQAERAVSRMKRLIDNHYADISPERGWYLQTLARYQYQISKADSIQIQSSAFNCNMELLKPKKAIAYKRLEFINENRIQRIKNWISQYSSYQEMLIELDAILSDLSFGERSEKFEKALQNVGLAMGFLSQRPDKEFKKGPDNLWCGVDDFYFIFECKNEVNERREEIKKSEVGQMNNHCAWFEKEYLSSNVKRIMIIETKKVSHQGDFAYEVEIMRKSSLRNLKSNIKDFFKEFKNYNIKEVSDGKIQEWIDIHKLSISALRSEYSEPYYQK